MASMMIDKPNYTCKNKGMAQWLNWIEQPPPKGQVAGSNPAWVTSGLFRVVTGAWGANRCCWRYESWSVFSI